MAKGYVLYNLKAGYDTTIEDVKRLEVLVKDPLKFFDVAHINDYKVFLEGISSEDYIIICGGDGTLNHFVNEIEGIDFKNEILYYPLGTGNDFANDLGYPKASNLFQITKYLKNLPYVLVNNKKYRFINGVGYGIDGYCCEVGDELKKTATKPVNYTSIAIKGLLFHYKPTNAKITVDGVSHTYEKVWLASTMNGRFYGGGMIPTPNQNRNSKDKTLSVMVLHNSGKLKVLTVFPSVFKGEHIKHTKMVDVLTGHEITVEFDRPTTLQIDGETISGVTSYSVVSAKSNTKRATFVETAVV